MFRVAAGVSKASRNPQLTDRPQLVRTMLPVRKFFLDQGHFAEGAFRLVYKGKYTEGRRKGQPCVCKVFKTGAVMEDAYFAADIKAVEKALHLVDQWNSQKFINRTIKVNRAQIWSFYEGRHKGQKNLVEPFIQNWEKFNSNSGWVNSDGESWSLVMQALSHYSYHVSSGQFVLCDLQGGIYSDGAIITDPVIISRSAGTYGPTDLGPDGILNFFGHHVCNKFCHSTWTKPRDTRRMYAPKASTSMVVTTQHSRPQLSRPAICEDYSSRRLLVMRTTNFSEVKHAP